MNEKIKNNKKTVSVSFILSVLIHAIIFIVTSFFLAFQINKPVINSVYLTLLEKETSLKPELKELLNPNREKSRHEELSRNETPKGYFSFDKTEYDTSKIKQIYREFTLNVSVRYPNGWTYIDQNVKDKLDGVTFWTHQDNYEVPPYIHLEVQDKYIFNPAGYKYKLEHKGNFYYYNDPEEMEGYYSQIIYIRTKSDEDYSIKLIVKGIEIFKSFQPVFFSMAKSFRFGNSFL